MVLFRYQVTDVIFELAYPSYGDVTLSNYL